MSTPTYVDAEAEIADEGEFVPDDDDADGVERLQTDLMVTGGVELDPLASTMFTSPYDDDDDDSEDTEDSEDEEDEDDEEEE